MAKEKRRNWLDKISRWILGALPEEKASAPQAPQQRAATPSSPTPQQPMQPRRTAEPPKPGSPEDHEIASPSAQQAEQGLQLPAPQRQSVAAVAPSSALQQAAPRGSTINQAWRAFELAWAAAGLSDHYFLEREELEQTLAVLDRNFEEELIEWLFQLCTKPVALRDLAGIIERGKVKPTDNIDAIRAFAYISIAVSARPKQDKHQGWELSENAQPEPVISHEEPAKEGPQADQPAAIAAADDSTENLEAADFQPVATSDPSTKLVSLQSTTGNLPIEDLDLSIRAIHCLKRSDIHTLLDLAGKTENDLLSIKNFGQKSVDEVRDALTRRNLSLPFQNKEITGGVPGISTSRETARSDIDDSDDLKTLNLAPRTLNCLYRGGISLISELLRRTESDLLAIPNLGQKALNEISTRLASRSLSLCYEHSHSSNQEAIDRESGLSPEMLEENWQQLKYEAIQQTGSLALSFEQLSQLCITQPGNPASEALGVVLQRLNATIEFIRDTLSDQYEQQADSLSTSIELLNEAVCGQILERTCDGAGQWINRITNSFTPQSDRNWLVFLLRCSGKTLSSIAEEQNPPLSRERVRQMESKVSKVVGIKPAELAEKVQEAQEAKQNSLEKQTVQAWLNRLGRLPTRDDPKLDSTEHQLLWDQVCEMSLKERVELLSKHKFEVSQHEYDFHYRYVAGQIGQVGTGYWREFEHLKQLIIRHAVALGAPDLMPKQTSFPDSVRGVVTSYGGQSKVAKRIGLKYQGQLVGTDGGRTYWTEERLSQLLTDTNEFHNQDHELMPSYGQVLEFFAETEIGEYQDKKAPSAIAALTKMGSLHWSEVAKRFNKRFVSGESQKAVTLSYIKAFVRDLGEHLESLTPSELFVLFQAQGINRGEKEKFSRTFDALVDAVQSGMVDKDELRSWADNNEVASIDDLLDLGAELKAESSLEEKEQKLLDRRSKQLMEEFPEQEGTTELSSTGLLTLEPANVLRALDKAGELVDNSATDSDKVEFLKAKATAKLWDACFQDEQTLIAKLKAFPAEADSYSQEVQQAFLDEYYGARALPIPLTYGFKDLKGTPRDPKLMQRLVAYRLERDLRLLNLSGTGTGKTLSAIYAAQICKCKRILISCPNGVINSWKRAFSSAFPSANLNIKPDGWSLEGMDEGVNVVIVNHERFQDRFAQQLLGFCVNYQADMIVIDEIHQSKRRSADTSSQRRKLMNEFIRISSNINTDLRVLGLSATPVINNLYEGRSLLELICQEPIDNVDEKVDLNSCMNLYQHFVVHGIRMNPGQLPRTKLIHQEVDATALLPEIVRATKKGTYHDIEQLLVKPKITSLKHCLERGQKSVIFVTYIKNTLRPITRWLAENNYSFSVYTGDEKEAHEEGFTDSLDEFIHGRSEVLVASVQCAGTGIDGLQSVCNRAIFFQLPWTSTEFEQAIGRLDRDGTDFDSITVHIPMTEVSLPDGQRWSWCRSKLDRIESKRDIAKAAVDGEIPDAATLISPSDASKYWLKWLERLDLETAQAATNT